MRFIRLFTTVAARFLISAVFLAEGISKIMNWHETERLLVTVLSDWQSYASFSETLQNGFASAVPWAPLILMAGTLFELVGGLLILLGFKEKWGAALLLLCLVPATVLMHQFWFAETIDRELQTALFLKNLAVLGGLLMILLHGAQAKASAKTGSDSLQAFKMG